MRRDARGIVAGDGVCGGEKIFVDARGVLVQDEDGEDIAEEHADEDERDAADHQQTARAQRGER